ncbi:hypothetical protein [Streptomyces sp. RerS4]|uniref:hypothetical protein n=1 Tax=Streptomyces sp. RerS4 TaxID=2942449 RepID=UPI00201C7656|nr:hypothetical protein [Streptomyces sp. RerS4]UQX04270.1 hypothetical protein M4D82_30025 [Streptomyces sp. RerS4]
MTGSTGTPPGGDRPVERVLREALSARAQEITVRVLRPADPPGPHLRRVSVRALWRRRSTWALAGLSGLAAAALAGFLFLGPDRIGERHEPPAAPPEPTSPAPAPSRSAPSPSSATPEPSVSAVPSAPPTTQGASLAPSPRNSTAGSTPTAVPSAAGPGAFPSATPSPPPTGAPRATPSRSATPGS